MRLAKSKRSLLTLAALAAVTCKTARPMANDARSVRDGVVMYEAVGDPSAAPSKLVPIRDYSLPGPSAANAPPTYPDDLLPLGLKLQEIVVRLVIDEQGNVAQLRPSPVPSKADVNHKLEFEAAIAEAVRRWCFTPAKLRKFVDGPDLDGDGRPTYQILKSEVAIKSYIDVRFLFEVREGKPVVTAGR